MSYNRVAVIGSNGFIGRAVTKRLQLEPGIQLSLFGRSAKSSFGDSLPYHVMELENAGFVKTHFSNTEVIYYLISETIPSTSWENPLLEIEKNLRPFIKFMEVVSTLNVRKVAFVSSAGTIYGASEKMVSENSDKHPFSPYGITKLTMEHYLNYFEKKYGILHDIYRVSNVYGLGQDTSKGLGIINTFLEKIIREKKIRIFGDGENTRNYIYVDDVAEFLTLSLKKSSASEIYNLSSNDTLRINELVKIMQEVLPEKFDVEYTATRQSDNSAIVLDNQKIRNALPAYQLMTIRQGIINTYEALKENQSVNSNGKN